MASVLVIDDEADIRDLLRELLTVLGYEVRMAENGDQGLKSYLSEPADVVLMDMFMPDKDGLETLRDLLRHDPQARVIAMSGGGTRRNYGILKPASFMGARRMLCKPITVEELQTTVEETLAMPKEA
ncbi:MAG: response regulator [Kiritimatiellia bacterium]